MARYGQRPENALKRANEFIEVGKPARALDTLQEVFRNKKWAYNWSESVLEPIMFKYLVLCVELKKSHIAKEGLFQYRNMFQSVNVGSLENVIRGYLRMAEEKAENAREQSAQAVIDIDDLDNVATPESILLSAVSGEDAQDRSDRTILTPWVKFLWESYCQCLELLRTNAHVENLYHDIARMAFQFCLKYNRKTEFRKLCDKLRKHLEDICKLPVQVSNVSMSKPETQQLNLETRLHQLDYGIQMELWQEAYKAIEDIHNLMNISKKMPVPKTMANYYQKLAMVFWKAGNYLFHAAALFKLFQLSKEMKKNITQEELQKMACHVLLATLAIPLPSSHPEFDRFIETDKSPLEKAQKLTVLLSLLQPPSRASILKDLGRANVISLATPQLQELYKCLEVDFSPLTLCTRVHEFIKSLEIEDNCVMKQYIPALQDVTLVRLVKQIAQVYQCIELARLIQIAKFTTPFYLERLLVDCVRHNDMQIRIDHRKQCINFGMDLSESQREDKPEGPTLQVMPSELVRNQLVDMATVLKQAVYVINPDKKKVDREKLRAVMVQNYHENKIKEHQKILQRHKIIEDRKEYIERLNTVREEEEQKRLEEIHRQQALAEQKRLEHEREERERKRALSEIQQIKDRHLKEKLQQFSQTEHGQKLLKKLDEDDLKKLDVDQIAAKEAEELQKERRELQAKLKSQEKKIDYFERAKRIEDVPLFQRALDEKQIQDRNFWEQQENERIQSIIEERKFAVDTRDRLYRMVVDKNEFLTKLKAQRRHVYEEKIGEFQTVMSEERKKRLIERKKSRREERRSAYLKNKREEAERKAAEEKLRQDQERERLEEMTRKEKEDLETLEREEQEKKRRDHLEMLERVAALKKAKEEEIEKKLLEERDGSRGKLKEDTFWRKVTDKEAAVKKDSTSSWRNIDKSDGEESKKTEIWRPRFRGATEEKPKTDSWRSIGEDRKEDKRVFDKDRESFSKRDGRYPPRDKEYKDERDHRGERGCREERDHRDRRDERDHKDERDRRGERDRREERDRRDRRGDRDLRVDREPRVDRDHRVDKDRRNERDYRDDRDRRDERDRRDPRDRREEKDRREDRGRDRREDRNYLRRDDQDRHEDYGREDDRRSWRNVTKTEDEFHNREYASKGVSEGSWRAKGGDRKDEPMGRDDRKVTSSQREKPSLDEPPQESEDGWSQVSRRR